MTEPSTWPLTGTSSTVPEAVVLGCRRVGADLSAGSPPSVRDLHPLSWWSQRDGQLPTGFLHLGLSQAGRLLFARGLDGRLTGDMVTVDIAEAVQDHLTGYEFTTWPECPGHPHPLSPRTVDREPVWCCPGRGDVVSPIGDLYGGQADGRLRRPLVSE